MTKTILIVGYGPGISSAVAEKFGREGYAVALVARNEARLTEGVASLEAKGIKAAAFPGDAGDAASMRAVVAKARATLGPIAVIEWTAYGAGSTSGDVVTASTEDLKGLFDVAIFGLMTTIQAALPDLKETKGALLITNGALGEISAEADQWAVGGQAMGLALANAAKQKLVGILAQRLKADGIYVGEVTVAGQVKGTAWDSGKATIEPSTIADAFWKLLQARADVRARIS